MTRNAAHRAKPPSLGAPETKMNVRGSRPAVRSKKVTRSTSICVEDERKLVALSKKKKASVSWLIARAIEKYLETDT